MPTPVLASLGSSFGSWDSAYALAWCRREGCDRQIPELAAQLACASQPCPPEALRRRLTALGMVMAPNRPSAEATMWLHEMSRLLRDLPQDIVFDAIDECQRSSKYLPTVAEIRLLADPRADERRKHAARLDAMARLIASGAAIPDLRRPTPPAPPAKQSAPMTPAEVEEMNTILATIGALTRYRPDGSRYEVDDPKQRTRPAGPRRNPTRQDYLDLGVNPSVLDQIECDQAA